MLIVVRIIGVVISALGLAIFALPVFSEKIFRFFKEGKRLYYAGVIRTVVGLVVLFVASQSRVPIAAVALGLMFLISGIAVFACDVEKMKVFIQHYSEMPPIVIRLIGLVAATFGVLIFAIF